MGIIDIIIGRCVLVASRGFTLLMVHKRIFEDRVVFIILKIVCFKIVLTHGHSLPLPYVLTCGNLDDEIPLADHDPIGAPLHKCPTKKESP